MPLGTHAANDPLSPASDAPCREPGLGDDPFALDALIVTYNSARFIEDCVASVRRALPGVRVFIVDNASTDGTRDILARMRDVVVTFNDRNEYLSPVWNRFLRASTRRYVMFINPDLLLHRGEPFLEAMRRMAENERFVVAGCLNEQATIQYMMSTTPPVRPHDLPVWQEKLKNSKWYKDIGQDAGSPEKAIIPYVHGECMLLHREKALSVGGFSKDLPLYFNDPEFCLRLIDHDFNVLEAYRVGDGTLTHYWGGSSNPDSIRLGEVLFRQNQIAAISERMRKSELWNSIRPLVGQIPLYRSFWKLIGRLNLQTKGKSDAH